MSQYPKSTFTRDFLVDNPDIKKLINSCKICSTLNQLTTSTNNAVEQAEIMPEQNVTARESRRPVYYGDQAMSEEMPTNNRISAGSIVAPKYIPAFLDVIESMACTPLGKLTANLGAAIISDISSGWAMDPGYKQASRELSDKFADKMNLCLSDKEELRKNVSSLVEEYRKTGDVLKSMKKGMLKTEEAILKDNGIEVKAKEPTAAVQLPMASMKKASLLG